MDKTTNLRRKEPQPPVLEKKKFQKRLPQLDLTKSQFLLPSPPDSDRFEEFDSLFVDDAQNCDADYTTNYCTSLPVVPFPSPHYQPNEPNAMVEDIVFPKPEEVTYAKGPKDLFAGTKFDVPYDPSEKLVESPIYRSEPSLNEDFIILTRNETKRYASHRQDFLDKSQSALDDLAVKYPDYKDQLTTWYNMIVDSAGKARFDLRSKLIALRTCTFQSSVSSQIKESIKEEINVLSDFLNNFDALEKERIQLMVWGAKLYAVWDGINALLY